MSLFLFHKGFLEGITLKKLTTPAKFHLRFPENYWKFNKDLLQESIFECQRINKVSFEDFVAMLTGELSGMQAWQSGKLKIEGDLMKSQLLERIFVAADK